MNTYVERACRYSGYIASVFPFLMMLLITSDVIGRKFFNSPLQGTAEIVELWMPLTVLLGLAYTHYAGRHVSIGLLVDRLRPQTQSIIDSVGYGAASAYVGILSWQAVIQFMISMHREEITAVLRLPVTVVRFTVIVGLGVLTLSLLVTFIQSLRKVVRP